MADFNAIHTPQVTSSAWRCSQRKRCSRLMKHSSLNGAGIEKIFQMIVVLSAVLLSHYFTGLADGAPAAAAEGESAYIVDDVISPSFCPFGPTDDDSVEYIVTYTEMVLRARMVVVGRVLRVFDFRNNNQTYSAEVEVFCMLKGDQRPATHIKIVSAGYLTDRCFSTNLKEDKEYILIVESVGDNKYRPMDSEILATPGNLRDASSACHLRVQFPAGVDLSKASKCPAAAPPSECLSEQDFTTPTTTQPTTTPCNIDCNDYSLDEADEQYNYCCQEPDIPKGTSRRMIPVDPRSDYDEIIRSDYDEPRSDYSVENSSACTSHVSVIANLFAAVAAAIAVTFTLTRSG